MSAGNPCTALSALAAVLVTFTIAGCSPGGSTPADPQAGSGSNANPTFNIGQQGELAGDAAIEPVTPAPTVAPDELLVKFKSGTPSTRIAAALPRSTAKSVRAFAVVPGLRHVKLAAGVTLDAALEEYRSRPDVEYAEPNYIVHAYAVPNDPRFGEQWGLNNTGQTGGVVNVDVDGPEAWDLTQGDSSVVVAVIDSGVEYTHPDLAANMYRNVAECVANGIDDDGNGFVDDCYGIDTANDDSDPADDRQHGTHVAGILGAVGNNGIGIAGVAWNVKILPCKFLGANGTGTTADAIACLDYVAALAARGVNIVATNNSWGGDEFSLALADAIETQRQQGILFIAAAGNFRGDHDSQRKYPCDHDSPNIVCVAWIDDSGSVNFFSDFGRHSVHIGAPGNEILSTLPGDAYGANSGTSIATPHVTGIAALLKAQDPTRDWRAIRNLILAGGKVSTALQEKTITGREASAFGSLTCSNSVVLERVWPTVSIPIQRPGDPVRLSMLHIDCATPNGAPTVSISPSGETVLLHDDGLDGDTTANDGIYSATWTSLVAGTYTLSFADGSTIGVTFDAHLRPGFPLKTSTFASGTYLSDAKIHTLVGNIDSDPELEIVRSALGLGQVYAWNVDGTRASGWPSEPVPRFDLLDPGIAYPVLGRFTVSNSLDVFATYTARRLAAISGSGQTLSGWPVSTRADFSGSAADLDGDGIDEIIVEDSDGQPRNHLRIYRSDGTRFPGSSIVLPASSQYSKLRTPAVVDLFGDGTLEIVAADNDRMYAYHHDGRPVAGFPVDVAVRSYPAVGDVDADGAPEIVVVAQVQDRFAIIAILSNTGVIERTITTPFGVVNDIAPALADLDGDGIPEIVVQFAGIRGPAAIAIWRGDGTALPGWPVSSDDLGAHFAPIVGDLDGDGAPDIVGMGRGDTPSSVGVRAYDRQGQLLAGFPKQVPSKDLLIPAIADLDLDGRNDLIVSASQWWAFDGRYDAVWAFDLGGPAGNAAIEWGQFMNDEKHSGFYETGKNLANDAYLATQILGVGTITSSPAGIACGADCIERYPKGTTVTLTASGDAFGRWYGACEGQGNPCVVSIQDYTTVLANFGTSTLSVNITGNGSVTSSPAGIACPGTCSGTFGFGNVVTLTAIPQADSRFTGWSGACSGQAPSCTVTMDDARSVTASFFPKPVLNVSVQGEGTITSSPPGIDCGADCSEPYDIDTVVTLTATPAPGYYFHRWQGACSGTEPTCTYTLFSSTHAQAVFFQRPVRELLVRKFGSGSGSVVSDLPGVDCGADCVESYDEETTVVLTARPDAGSIFMGWSGGCSGNAPTCTVLVTSQQTVAATFDLLPPPTFELSVNRSGSGAGIVISMPAGIDCGGDCSEAYVLGTSVTLTAHPTFGSFFNGWQGACNGTEPTCTVTMNQAQHVTAVFNQQTLRELVVAKMGGGSGSVSSEPAGIDCGADCVESYTQDTTIVLTARPNADSIFVGWSGACSGNAATCTVLVTGQLTATAVFEPRPPDPTPTFQLSVSKTGSGAGLVSSLPAGINCADDCSGAYAENVIVTLTATPAPNSSFTGWTGACSGQSTSCTVTMNENKSVGAAFGVATPPPSDGGGGGGSGGGGGGGGGGGQFDWALLALGATLFALRRRWSARGRRA